jgi:hypothetical protein
MPIVHHKIIIKNTFDFTAAVDNGASMQGWNQIGLTERTEQII